MLPWVASMDRSPTGKIYDNERLPLSGCPVLPKQPKRFDWDMLLSMLVKCAARHPLFDRKKHSLNLVAFDIAPLPQMPQLNFK
jgi:hypothetical protein